MYAIDRVSHESLLSDLSLVIYSRNSFPLVIGKFMDFPSAARKMCNSTADYSCKIGFVNTATFERWLKTSVIYKNIYRA